MVVFSLSDALPGLYLGAILLLPGLALLWRGLLGGPNGERGLLRRRAGALGRIEGFRVGVVGLALLGVAAAWIWQAPLFLFLALGIGGVEALESSVIIAVWRRDGGRVATNPA